MSNKEQGMVNVEVQPFIIHYSLFTILYSN